jgi:hypothetical protein
MVHFMQKSQVIRLICFISLALLFYGTDMYAEENLPPIPSGSDFLDQIDLETYPSFPSPQQTPLLRWDFSGDKVYPFDFSQKMIMKNEMDSMSGNENRQVTTQNMEGYGKLSLKSEGNNIARFVLEDLTVNIQISVPDSNEPKVMKSQAPPIVIQGIKEDGSMKLGNSAQELLLKTLFPLPPTPLKIGESVSIPAQMPFNAMGSLLHVTGNSEIKLAGYVQINGKTCAKLQTEIDISTLNVPEEIQGSYKCQVKGRSIFYFNIEDRHFMSGRVAMLMSIRVEAPTPKMDFPQETDKGSVPEILKMAMDSDNYISVDYISN